MASKEELKAMIVDLKVELMLAKVPHGHCPYAYYHEFSRDPEAECNDCYECKENLVRQAKQRFREEVDNL